MAEAQRDDSVELRVELCLAAQEQDRSDAGDRRPDIVTASKRGVFYFVQP